MTDGSPRPSTDDSVQPLDVCVIGAGQSALALGYYLRRLQRHEARRPVSFALLDDQPGPGGAWSRGWDSLALFSPATYSSLAGRPMPPWRHDGNPSAAHVEAYLRDYESRYELPIQRPHRVIGVRADQRDPERIEVWSEAGTRWSARVVVNATGTWSRPFWPGFPGADSFAGTQLHTADYRSAAQVPGRRVLVVGGGNSGAQIAADLLHSDKQVTWAARNPPRFLPDEVDGRALFEVATSSVQARSQGLESGGVADLGDVVAVPSVRTARDRHGLRAIAMPQRLTATEAVWADGHTRQVEAVVWATGFRPALHHLRPLGLSTISGHPEVAAPTPGSFAAASADDPRVYFLGYGDWCAPASATLIGVNRAARDTASAIAAHFGRNRD